MKDCDQVIDDLADIVAGDRAAIARHADHIASCDTCRDLRHDASQLAALAGQAGSDHVPRADLADRVLAVIDAEAKPTEKKPEAKPVVKAPTPVAKAPKRPWAAVFAAAIAASGAAVLYKQSQSDDEAPVASTQTGNKPRATDGTSIGTITNVARASADTASGVFVKDGDAWKPLAKAAAIPHGASLKTDERTRVSLELADGSKLVLDHDTVLAFDRTEPRKLTLTKGRLSADVAHVEKRPASVQTPSGTIDIIGTRFMATATDSLTAVQVVRGSVSLVTASGQRDEVHAGEEGQIDNGALSVGAAPSLAHEIAWSELEQAGPASKKDDELAQGLGALRAYKPGEKRDRDWNLALAQHDVKVRIVGPVARTEITETFKNDSNETLDGVYQFPLPPDAQIDSLELDVEGGFEQGAFVDKQRGAKIWQGVIDKATPKLEIARKPDEIIWVDGSWRDPALLDWKRGGRFELRIFPIPAKGQRTIKIAYTQVVTPRGANRQYTYPLAHSTDGSTVANNFSVDVEVRGARPGQVRAAGYALTADPARAEVSALTFQQGGFVPRGDLVVEYEPVDTTAELRAWTFTGGAAVAPDEKLAAKKNVGIDPKVVDAQRKVAADTRPTAVLALRPKLPRWRESKPRDIMIVVDSSQSMVGERFTRATELAATIVGEMDRRDRFTVAACDSECARLGGFRAPSETAVGDVKSWLGKQVAAGASDIVASVRSASSDFNRGDDREDWVLYIGDGFSTTGFRRASDIEGALANMGGNVHISTIGIGGDADAMVLKAAARGGGGSYLAWVPGLTVGTAALAALESTNGAQLRNATIELPSGLADVAPTVLPTVRSGEEVLVAARLTGDVRGDVVVKGTVGGQPFEQRYPVQLAMTGAAGNGFVPRLWASLAIDQLERTGGPDARTQIVALSQGYGVMSRETSLLVLESAAMFEAFGVDRGTPAAKWTGEDAIDEVITSGSMPMTASTTAPAGNAALARDKAEAQPEADSAAFAEKAPEPMPAAAPRATTTKRPASPFVKAGKGSMDAIDVDGRGDDGIGFGRRGPMGGGGIGQMAFRKTWVRTPSLETYAGVSDSIKKAIDNAEAALAASPDSREKHRALVQAYAYAGEIDKAREIAAKWLERDKLDPHALGYQADLLGRDGQRELALRTLAGLVDLDADRTALHERMVHAYEASGRMSQACGHRIALSSIAPKDTSAAAGAMRCLRSVGRDRDAELIKNALADDATRAAAEKAATLAIALPKITGDLVIHGTWASASDLDISVVAPDGSRVSWMGGRTDAFAADANAGDKEQLAIKSLKRGNYLIEVTRGATSTGPVRGTLDITALGQKKSMPFELLGSRAVVARLNVTMKEAWESVPTANFGPRVALGPVPSANLQRVMMARTISIQNCYAGMVASGSAGNRIVARLELVVGQYGQITTRVTGAPAGLAQCIKNEFAGMHDESGARTFSTTMTFTNN
ncbi:MAG: FecR domain-containing protein [Kofleriaceae bacterium]|nr:FecR domain-containing protein [Kofleriaceae bacterium]